MCEKAAAIVDQVFIVFFAICNGFEKQFADKHRLPLAKREWTIAFMDEKITCWNQIENGIKLARKKPNLVFIPSLGDFLLWCNEAKQDNFLSKEKAYLKAYELMRDCLVGDLSDEQLLIINHAIQASDQHFLKTNARSSTEPVFYRNYEIALRDFLNGDLKPIPKAIENKSEVDNWKTLSAYGVLPEYAYLTSREKAMPVIDSILKKNCGLSKKLPYDKHKRS